MLFTILSLALLTTPNSFAGFGVEPQPLLLDTELPPAREDVSKECVGGGGISDASIVARDTKFYEYMPEIWHKPEAREMFAGNAPLAAATAQRNATLQGAYLMIAARAVGLDCGPMSGFDAAKVDAEFFPDGRFKTDFLCNLGYGDPSKLFGRQNRLPFETVCTIV